MDYQKAIKERLEAIENFLQFEPVDGEAELLSIMTLGEYWDVPEVIMQALDQHPQFEARYIGLKRTCEIAKNKAKAKLDFFEAKIKEYIDELIFSENIKASMTANNARPTGAKINNRYMVDVIEGDPNNKQGISFTSAGHIIETIGECVKLYRTLIVEFELAEGAFLQVKIITDALKTRAVMLTSMCGLMGRLVDNKLIILKKGHRRSKADEDGFS